MARLLAGSLPVVFVLAGCGAGGVTASPSNSAFSIAPGTAVFDTSCTGCNAAATSGAAAERFTATLASGGAAQVVWSVSGGDSNSGPGTISASGLYTPPSYLTGDSAQVVVKATLVGTGATPIAATSVLTITPGFLQPLTPENAALGAGGATTVTGYIAQAGGSLSINYVLASSPTGSSGGQGSLGAVHCHHGDTAFAWCTAVYTAPAAISSTSSTWLVARIGSTSIASSQILLNTSGVSSNPIAHELQQQNTAVLLGSSGGNNKDYDVSGNQIVDCCSGTLGALVEDATGRQYLLSNNHVLARSDRANVGDAIVQPGLIDNNCTPYGEGAGTTPIATLSAWLPLSAKSTNADAALAQVNSHAINPAGSILELGSMQAGGTLAAAPPGVTSTGGKGEAASLALRVAKSGRSTGLTCGAVSAVSLDIQVSYFKDCAETKSYLTKTFTNQVGLSGHQFSDAGDSGALVVDANNAEPVGLFFAGGHDANGLGQAVATPASAVLSELGATTGTSLSFVGGADHSVSCLNYGAGATADAQARTLSSAENARMFSALEKAHSLVNPAAGILAVATGKSSDRPGEGALLVYVDENSHAQVPATVYSLRTVVIATTARAVASGTAPSTASAQTLSATVLAQAIAAKQQASHTLLGRNRAFFGVGVSQSLDNPAEAALVVYVDRRNQPSSLPATINGLRTRYVVMDRFHVSRSYATEVQSPRHCRTRTTESKNSSDPFHLNLFRFF
jgi:hypothetical protein